MAPIVLGGRIITLPQQDLSGLLGGVGDILGAIGQQRQQSADRQALSDLNRVLTGDVLPAGQEGPVRPGITDPQERFRAIMETIPQLRRPQNQALALELAKTQAGVIPTTGAGADPIQDAIFTDAQGTKRNIKARLSTIARSPNLDFPEVTAPTEKVGTGREAKAQVKGFDTFASAPTEVKAEIDAEVQQDKIDVARAKIALKQEGAISTVANVVEEITPLTNRIFTSKGIADRFGQSLINLGAVITQQGQRGQDVATYESIINGVVGQFAKVVSGEGGRLTNEDIARAKGLFPDTFGILGQPDTKVVAQEKVKFLARNLERARQRILRASGITPTGRLFDKGNLQEALDFTDGSITVSPQDPEDVRLQERIDRARGRR